MSLSTETGARPYIVCKQGQIAKYIAKQGQKARFSLDSSKGMGEDFLIVSGGWHDGTHYPTQEGEPGSAPEDRGHT